MQGTTIQNLQCWFETQMWKFCAISQFWRKL